jgi:hypothetical protein
MSALVTTSATPASVFLSEVRDDKPTSEFSAWLSGAFILGGLGLAIYGAISLVGSCYEMILPH